MNTQETETRSPIPFFDASRTQAMFGQQVQMWCKAQTDFLAAWQSFADGWFEHRRQGLAAAADAFGKICACHDLSEVGTVQQQWVAGVVDRVSADARAATETAASVSRHGIASIVADDGHSQPFADEPPSKSDRREKSRVKEAAE